MDAGEGLFIVAKSRGLGIRKLKRTCMVVCNHGIGTWLHD